MTLSSICRGDSWTNFYELPARRYSLCFPTDIEECLRLKCCSSNSKILFGLQDKMLARTTLTWRTVEFIHTQMLNFAFLSKICQAGQYGECHPSAWKGALRTKFKKWPFFHSSPVYTFLILLILLCNLIYILACSLKPLMWDACIHLNTHLLSLSCSLFIVSLRKFSSELPSSYKTVALQPSLMISFIFP